MKHVFIIGARGYHAKYGGWETFVSKLVDNYNDTNTVFHISALSSNNKNEEIHINNNIIVNTFYIKQQGFSKMFLCTIKAFNYYLKYIKENNIKNTYLYVLGLKLGPMLFLRKHIIKRLGITILVNPDGLEHERAKWNYLIKKCFLLSEHSMLHNADIIICDAKGIKKYIDKKYPKLSNKTNYIAYGTDNIVLKNIDEKQILDKYELKKDKYILMVGRFVPENNYELVIKEFMKSKVDKDLIIISNISSSNYYSEVLNKTNCHNDSRIKFINGVYDEVELSTIRKNAFAYIHGHSVGGTNPSLLEALNLTNLNILYDVCFNKDVGSENCLYFKKEGSLTKILNEIDNYNRKEMGKEAKKIINNNFTWDIIVNKYKEIFNNER